MKKQNPYDALSERELIDSILSGNEEAAIYLIYNRYYRDLRYLCFDYCGSHEYIDDVCHEVYILLKGKNGDWHPLSTWKGLSTFRTWLNHTVQNYLCNYREDLIGLSEKKLYSEKEDDQDPVEKVESHYPSIEENMQKVLLLEAINKLKNEEHRLIFIKELQGYNHAEIAEMVNLLRAKENRLRIDEHNHPIFVDAKTIDRIKQQAMVQLKKQFLALKETLC